MVMSYDVMMMMIVMTTMVNYDNEIID